MTEPIEEAVFTSGTQELVETAKRLGLIWSLRVATLVTISPTTGIYDGDTEAIDMVSMIGTNTVGDRVYVLFVPPSGNFIVGKVRALEVGSEILSFGPATSFTTTVTFTNPFLAIPVVGTNINSGAGSTSGWGSRAFNVTTSSFTLFVFGSSSTWSNIEVFWWAIAR